MSGQHGAGNPGGSIDRRAFVKWMALVAFAVPVVASFKLDSLARATPPRGFFPNQKLPNQRRPNQTCPNQSVSDETFPNQTCPNQTHPNMGHLPPRLRRRWQRLLRRMRRRRRRLHF